ncbi:MAG TPA: XrtB/PEP-CTERM-associated polysaccharide biosynthesis outer membrane protein EpsL [Burkholderiales bacterium]|nr:XrtB/PEP-CTERM-associated polysaccharide biosynthesis outer membrane protein EpsL [Burkholderiales bacterium]
MKATTLAAAVLLAGFSAATCALETLDDLYWPESGRFPAYPAERDDRPVRFFVHGGIDRDSNVFRLSDTASPAATLGTTQKSDTIRRGGAGIRADVLTGRQRFLVDVQAEYRDYDHFDQLDHTQYQASATWRWELGSRLSGDLGYARRYFLSDFGDTQINLKDMITEDRFFVSGGYLVTPRWRVRGALDWLRFDHSEPTRVPLDARIAAVTAGLDYVTPAGNSIGGQVRVSEGQYPNQQPVGATLVVNDYEEVESSLVAHWRATGKSTLDARAGYTRREHDQVPQRDFGGFTGRLNYDWFIAAKTLLNFAVWREIRSVEFAEASYTLTEGWGLGPAWAPTIKLVFQARYFDEDREYKGSPAFVLAGTPQRNEKLRGISLTAGYTPRRHLQFSLGVEKGERSSNIAGGDYEYTLFSANARLLF